MEIEKLRELSIQEVEERSEEILKSVFDNDEALIVANECIELVRKGLVRCLISNPFDGNFYFQVNIPKPMF